MAKKHYYLRLFIILIGITGLLTIFPNHLYRLRYYTYLSNFLVVVFYTYLLFVAKKMTPTIMRIKSGVTIMIMLTFIVYNVLLLPKVTPVDFWQYRNFALHYFVPILTIFDWAVFDKNVLYKKVDPLLWAILPLMYCFITLIIGYVFQIPLPNEKHSPYPYFFLNVTQLGWNGLLMYCSIITACYIAIGYLMIGIKKLKK